EEARLHARLRQELRCVPVVLRRDLRQEESAVRALGNAQPVYADGEVFRQLFRLLHFDQLRGCQDADLDGDAVDLIRPKWREAGILRGALRALLDRLDERDEPLRV